MEMTQKAIILAAGRGSRMEGLCQELPKPMLEVHGRPILAHSIDHLLKSGITHIGINTHHQHQVIYNYVKTYYPEDIIHIIHEKKLTGTAGALRSFKDFLADQEQFLVVAGDILTNYPYQKLIQFHKKTQADISFVYHERMKSNSFLEIDDHSKVITFHERPSDNIFKANLRNKVNSSIYCFNREVLNSIPDERNVDIPLDLFPQYLKEQKLFATPLIGKRWAIDTPARLGQARKEFL